jgi:hypothetical protein
VFFLNPSKIVALVCVFPDLWADSSFDSMRNSPLREVRLQLDLDSDRQARVLMDLQHLVYHDFLYGLVLHPPLEDPEQVL